MPENKKRFWEIDSLRGIAIIMMILYHLLFDLYYFNFSQIEVITGFWRHFAVATAAIFIFLAGVSLTLSYNKTLILKKKPNFSKYLIRGLKILSWGLIITFFTYIFAPQAYVRFGILHLIGLSIILAYPFLKLKYANLFLGIILIFLGLYLRNFNFDFPWLLWLGFIPEYFLSMDYFPLLPWFGLVLIGIFAGHSFYPKYKPLFHLPDLNGRKPVKYLVFLGKNSLLIYLIHQPVILGALYLINILIKK